MAGGDVGGLNHEAVDPTRLSSQAPGSSRAASACHQTPSSRVKAAQALIHLDKP